MDTCIVIEYIHNVMIYTYLCGSICSDIKSSSRLKCVCENSTALSEGSIGGGRASIWVYKWFKVNGIEIIIILHYQGS